MSELQTIEVFDQGTAMVPHANPYLSMIETMVSRGGDLSNLDKMLDLQIKWEANEARKAYVAAMAAFKAEPMSIGKNKHVSFRTSKGVTEYDHAELSDVTAVVVPAMAKHSLSHRWTIKQESGKITVACVVTHSLGHSEVVEMTAPADDSGGKNTIQAIASTKTYLERYTLLASVGMATGGQDDDGRSYAADPEPEPVDAKASDWITQVNLVQEPGDWAPLKAKMMADYGGIVKSIPNEVKQAFVDVKARIMPKDEA